MKAILSKVVAATLSIALVGCAPQEESVSSVKVDPVTAAAVAIAVASAVMSAQDSESKAAQMRNLSSQIAACTNLILDAMRNIFAQEQLTRADSFLQAVQRFEDWKADATVLELRIGEGNEITNQLISIVNNMGTEQGLKVAAAMNLLGATTAVLMDFKGTDRSIIKDSLKRLGVANYRLLAKHLPDRWYPRITAPDQGSSSITVSSPGLFKLKHRPREIITEWKVQASKVAAQSDPLFSEIVDYQTGLRQIVNINVRPHEGFLGYMWVDGAGGYKGDGHGRACEYKHEDHLAMDGGSIDVAKFQSLTMDGIHLHVGTGPCLIVIPEGTFKHPESSRVFYSNGNNAFCKLGPDAGTPQRTYRFRIDQVTSLAYHGNCGT